MRVDIITEITNAILENEARRIGGPRPGKSPFPKGPVARPVACSKIDHLPAPLRHPREGHGRMAGAGSSPERDVSR